MTARYGLTLPHELHARREVEVARLAESLGYTDLWNGEVSGADGVVSMAAAATATSSARLGTGILNVYSRTPMVLAMAAASLQNLSGGRFCLGIGTSSPRIVEDWHGQPFDRPLERIRDVVGALRTLLDGERSDVDGSVHLRGARLAVPPESPVPIYLAALGPRMLRLAGEIGDGVLVNFVAPADLTWIRAELEAGRERSGRTATDLVARIFLPYPGDDDAAVDQLREILAAYATTPVYRALLERIGFAAQVRASLDARAAGDRVAARRAIDDEMVRALAVVGTPEEQRAQVAEYVAAGADVPVLTFFHRPLAEDERVALTREAMELFRP